MAQDARPVPPTQDAPEAARQAQAGHPEPIWAAEQAARLRQRWQALQLRFSSAVAARRRQLDAWRDDGGRNGETTEQMRIAVRDYRYLLDRLLAG
jgi:hypothetical protein